MTVLNLLLEKVIQATSFALAVTHLTLLTNYVLVHKWHTPFVHTLDYRNNASSGKHCPILFSMGQWVSFDVCEGYSQVSLSLCKAIIEWQKHYRPLITSKKSWKIIETDLRHFLKCVFKAFLLRRDRSLSSLIDCWCLYCFT